MTVHGSKGLEFEAVHLPGLTVASFPTSNRGERCPPPKGMIDGSGDASPKEVAKRAHIRTRRNACFSWRYHAPGHTSVSTMRESNPMETIALRRHF